MTRTKRLALAFYLGAVAAGAAIGITVDRWILRERLVNQWDDPRAMRVRLANELGLDAKQRAALDSILDTRNRRYDELMAPMRPRLDSVSVLARQQIRLVSAKQIAELCALALIRRRRARRRTDERPCVG